MNLRRAILGIAAGAAGVALAGTAAGVVHQRRVIAHRDAGEAVALGSLRAPALTVVADDGVALHVEVDEARDAGHPVRTVVFVHGYALNLDCWHFQRAAYRGQVRAVFYDQRSHGRSGRSDPENATIEQLGADLLTVLDHVAPDEEVVLVGHSMGGMSIIALAEAHPELFGTRVVGVGLVATTAGGLDPSRVLLPLVPKAFGGPLALRFVAGLSRGHRVVDGFRKVGKSIAMVGTDRFAFGSDVPERYVAFVDDMLSRTPFEVLAQFFPAFGSLDKFGVVPALEKVPTTIVCGTKDRLTSIGHARKLHAHIEGSRLVELEDAGHMVIMERHVAVNDALDELFAAVQTRG
ncbi:MAG TPA: alpha/beta hydrolase [Nocardioides sp.]